MKTLSLTVLCLFLVSLMDTPQAEAKSRRHHRKQASHRPAKKQTKRKTKKVAQRRGPAIPGFGGKNCARPGDTKMCMVCNNFFEAGNQSRSEMVKVGKTVMTRVASKQYPSSPCGVVYENYTHKYPQFSWHRRRNKVLPKGGQQLADAIAAADIALKAGPNGATHYFANYIRAPRWSRTCHVTDKPGVGEVHIFFRCPHVISDRELASAQSKYKEQSVASLELPDLKTVPRPQARPSFEPLVQEASLQVNPNAYGSSAAR